MEKKLGQDKRSEDRREFLAKAGKLSMGVPATALLISVANKRARAQGFTSIDPPSLQ